MIFLGIINGGDTTLLLAGAGGLIDGRDTMLLLSAGQRFGYLCATRISVRGRTDRRWRHNAISWYDQWRQHNATFLGWLMVGGNTGHSLGVTDKILTHTEIKKYTNIGINNEYTLASTGIGTIRY
jgi:hypothetical protein